MEFAKIKELTQEEKNVVAAIRGLKACVLNEEETAVKPNMKTERNTIILRDIPSATAEVEVKGLFEGYGTVTSVRSDVGDTW